MKTQSNRTFFSFFLRHLVEYLVWIFPIMVIGIAMFLSGLARAYYSDYFEYKIIGLTFFLLLSFIGYPLGKIIKEYKYFKFKENVIADKNIATIELEVEIEFSKSQNGMYSTKEFNKTMKAEVSYNDNVIFILMSIVL